MKTMKCIIFMLAISMSAYADTNVPNTFVSGETAEAAAVNANFTALASAINGISGLAANIETAIIKKSSDKNTVQSSGSEVLSITCGAGEVLVGGGCACLSDNYDSSTTNWGNIHACSPAGNSYVGYCAIGFSDWDSNKFGSAFTIYAICAKTSSSKVNKIQSVANDEAIGAIRKVQGQMNAYESYMLDKPNK